jgi:ATPase subunit of ABC transporter with duplicated ATPase domains
LLDDITLAFFPGAKIGVLGPNGAGKSTLLRIMAGVDKEFTGEARPAPGLRIGFLPQEPELDPAKTVFELAEEGVAETRALLTVFEEVSAKFAEPMDDDEMQKLLDEQGRLQDRIDACNAWELDRTVEIAMDALRLPPGDAKAATLSGGEKRRVALCRLLLQAPDMLLLDEPTNHLDAESVAWLEHFLQSYPGTVIAVTHDRYFLDNVAGWILELDRGAASVQGQLHAWLEQKKERLAHEEKQASARQRTLDRELEWIRMSPRAGRRSRKRASRRTRRWSRKKRRACPRPSRSTSRPAHAWDIWSSRPRSCARATATGCSSTISRSPFRPAESSASSARTAPARRLSSACWWGRRQPDSGALKTGDTVALSYVEQDRSTLDPKKNVWEEISGGRDKIKVGKREIPSRAYVAAFGFKGSDQQKPVGKLSGGRAQPSALGEAAGPPAATCCCSTSRRTTSTSTRCARSKTRCSVSPAASS